MKMCKRCHGMHKIVIGALLLLNAYIWPMWAGIDGWIKWIAILMVVGGLVKLLVPNKCSACNSCATSTPAKKGKK